MTDKADNSLKESLSALMDGEASELELRRILKHNDTESDYDEQSPRQVWRRYQLMGAAMRGELRNVLKEGSNVDLSSRIAAAISLEDEEMAARDATQNTSHGQSPSDGLAETQETGESHVVVEHKASSWYSGFGQAAVAATVAMVLVFGVTQYSPSPVSSPEFSAELANAEKEQPYTGESAAIVPEGYRVPELHAVTVSNTPGEKYRPRSFVSSPLPESRQAFTINARSDEDMKEQMQRMLMLHAEVASEETVRKVVPFARLSAKDK